MGDRSARQSRAPVPDDARGTVTTAIDGPRATTFVEAPRLSELLDCDITIATETFQHTGSFKFRAAWNVVNNIPNRSVVAASSGNFGQALALACAVTGKRCTVVMPDNSSQVKIDAVREYGATADLIATASITREARVAELANADAEAYVASAYDDPLVIQGNATLGRELAARRDAIDMIVVPVGGGGLASGIILGLREEGVETPVIAAEPLLANDFAESMRAGRIVPNAREVQTIADGARTRSVGENNWRILQHGVAGVVEVPEDAIVEAVRRYFLLANLKVESTGAVALGALATDPDRFRGRRVCVVVSGGNVDAALYASLIAPANA